jgi:hypothetical protein
MLLIDYLRAWWECRKIEKVREAALNKYGWDAVCPSCGKWYHADERVAGFGETDMHWHYFCKCGHQAALHLYAMMPIHDPDYAGPPPIMKHYQAEESQHDQYRKD